MDRANTIGQLPTEHSRRFQARSLAAMFGAAAALGLLAAALPHARGVNSIAWAINSSLGLPAAGVLLFTGQRTRRWMLHAFLVGGALMVSLGMLFGDGGPSSVATSFFFVWVALYAYWFFAPRTATVHIAVNTLLLAAALAVKGSPDGITVWLLVSATAVVVGVVVSLMRRQLIRAITVDPLTRLPTRYTLITAFDENIARARRRGTPLCVAIMDIDGLKAVNDEHGHQAGDQLLVSAARAWRRVLRESDVLVRFGGDEFVALFPDCNPDAAAPLLDRLHEASPISWSAGLAWWRPGDTAVDMLARADAELYRHKRATSTPSRRRTDNADSGSTVLRRWTDLVTVS